MANDIGPWIAWEGGPCPVPGKRVHYRMGDGDIDTGHDDQGVLADALRWTHENDSYTDIIAYRVVTA